MRCAPQDVTQFNTFHGTTLIKFIFKSSTTFQSNLKTNQKSFIALKFYYFVMTYCAVISSGDIRV